MSWWTRQKPTGEQHITIDDVMRLVPVIRCASCGTDTVLAGAMLGANFSPVSGSPRTTAPMLELMKRYADTTNHPDKTKERFGLDLEDWVPVCRNAYCMRALYSPALHTLSSDLLVSFRAAVNLCDAEHRQDVLRNAILDALDGVRAKGRR